MWARWWSTLGTTAIGAVDPLDEIVALRERYGFRVHVDAAYGGYFRLIPEALDEPARRAYAAIDQADSIVVDPHKHGLQPYGCGCVLFRDPAVGRFYKHDSPYTYFTSKELHLGEISLECSRAGAAAVALVGDAAAVAADAGRRVCARAWHADGRQPWSWTGGCGKTRSVRRFGRGAAPELDIVVWKVNAADRRSSLRSWRRNFCGLRHARFASGPCTIAAILVWSAGDGVVGDGREASTCLRSVLMKPEHEAWLDCDLGKADLRPARSR